MKTFFLLDSGKLKIGIVHSTNIQWTKRLNSTGDFSIEIDASEYNPEARYIYRDSDEGELGIIQKVSYTYTPERGKVMQLSGNFLEGLLYNIPLTAFCYKRQLDTFPGKVFYNSINALSAKEYEEIVKNNLYAFAFAYDSTPSATVIKACRSAAQLSLHEFNKFKYAYGLDLDVQAFDDVDVPEISDYTFSQLDNEDETGEVPSIPFSGVDEELDIIDKDTQRVVNNYKRVYTIPKGSTSYLGDVLYQWLNSYHISDSVYFSEEGEGGYYPIILTPYLRCIFNPLNTITKLKFYYTPQVSGVKYSDQAGNIASFSYSQDISIESSYGIARAVYLKDASDVNPGDSPYGVIDGVADRDVYTDSSILPLNPLREGKVAITTEYLGNVFEDYVTKYECIKSVKDNLANFTDSDSTISYSFKPVIPSDVEYTSIFDIGYAIIINDIAYQIVEINEVVKDGGSDITLTLNALQSTSMQSYFKLTHSEFSGYKKG